MAHPVLISPDLIPFVHVSSSLLFTDVRAAIIFCGLNSLQLAALKTGIIL
jgi:hypothetical protein